jgi:hypothetical protein
VEIHVRACAECAAEVALLRDLRASMARVPAVDPARIAAAIPAYRVPVRRSWGGWRAAAAIAVIVVGGTSVVMARQESPRGPDSASTVPPRELVVANGASELSDGELQVLLNDIESIDAVPSVEVENAVPVSPVSPQGSSE